MKVTSINFIKEADVPKPIKNTELSQVCTEIAEAVKKAPAGQVATIKLDNMKRWTSYAIKRALKMKHGMDVQLVNRDGLLYILRKPTGKATK